MSFKGASTLKPFSFSKLKVDKEFQPCPFANDDEIFPNGIFEFNITQLLKFIGQNPAEFVPEKVKVDDLYTDLKKTLDEPTVASADITKPLILAEISPGRFNVIDGNHRLERAYRDGVKEVFAYRLKIPFHLKFLISHEGYIAFVEYWNEKVARL